MRMLAQWEATMDEDGDASRQSKRGSMPKSMHQEPASETFPGLPCPETPRGRRQAPVLPIPDVQGRVHHQVPLFEGQAKKASTTVIGTKWQSRRCRCNPLLLE
jgi:hypothetical protein